MRRELKELLICPVYGSKLEFIELEISADNHVLTGIFHSPQGLIYPVINGVPRMLRSALAIFEEFSKSHEKVISGLNPDPDNFKLDPIFARDFLPTMQQFGTEWGKHNLKGKTWGWNQEERIDKYLEYMQLERKKYQGRKFLDLGAGTGQFTCTLAKELECEMVGVDLSPAIELGERLRMSEFPDTKVSFVQANLMEMPFAKDSFEFVHASGVLHHTPDTHLAFKRVSPLVQENGKLGVWLYRPSDTLIPLIPFIKSPKFCLRADRLRPMTSTMNPKLLYIVIKIYATFFHLVYKLNELFRKKKHEQSIAERTTSLFDTLAPTFVYKHGANEVFSWFNEEGYEDLVETDQENVSGFNVCGVKRTKKD
ncbi:MAG: methyltransferase domain-containing protein [Vicingaceae bacterium]